MRHTLAVLALLISTALALQVSNVKLTQVSAVFFNLTCNTDQAASIYVQYWPTGGNYADTLAWKSLPSVSGTSHTLFLSRLYDTTTYNYAIKRRIFNTVLSQGTFATTALPTTLQAVHVSVLSGTPDQNDLNLASFSDFSNQGGNYPYIWNNKGRIVWYLHEPVNFPAFGLAQEIVGNSIFVNAVTELKEYKPWGTLVKSGKTDGCPNFHHELHLNPGQQQQSLYTLNYEFTTANGQDQLGDTFAKWDLNSNTVQIVGKTSDYFDPTTDRTTDSNAGIFTGYWPCTKVNVTAPQDWTHGNALTQSWPSGKYLVYSSRSLSTVLIIDQSNPGTYYYVGGTKSSFTFPNAADKFSVQHTPHITQDYSSTILLTVFDNGVTQAYSRALTLSLNLNTMQATKLWDYRLSTNPNCLGNFTGSVYPMLSGDYLVNFPTCNWNFQNPGTSYTVRLNSNGQEKWIYSHVKDNLFFNYRTNPSYGPIAGETLA